MYGGYRIGKPAHPTAAALAAGIGWHEGADGDDPAGGIAVAVVEADTVREPRIVDLQAALCRVTGEQHEVLVAAESNLGDDRPARVELALDRPEVRTEPVRKRDPTAGVARHGIPDQLVIEGITAVRRQPRVEGTRIGIHAVAAQPQGDRSERAAGGPDPV